MERKTPIRWTQREETLVAIEAERIGQNLEALENRLGNGKRAESLASRMVLAQRVLPGERRKGPGWVHYSPSKLHILYSSALARRAIYVREEAMLGAAAPDPAPAEAAPPAPPPTPAQQLAELFTQFFGAVEQYVAEGVKRALLELRDEEQKHAQLGTPKPHLATSAEEAIAMKRKVDVVGLKPNQCEVVAQSDIAREFDIRFIHSNSNQKMRDLRGEVILCRKFVPHVQQNRYRSMGVPLNFANGGAQSVIVELQRMVWRGAGGNGKHQ